MTNTADNKINYNEPGPPYGCFKIQCETYSSDLPLSSGQTYTVGQFYESGVNVCFNTLYFFAQVENECITTNSQYSTYSHYPWVASYDDASCAGPVNYNMTYYLGCVDNPNVPTSAVSIDRLSSKEVPAIRPLFSSLFSLPNIFVKNLEEMKQHAWQQQHGGREGRELGLWYGDDEENAYDTFSYTIIVGTRPTSSSSSSSLSGGAIAGISLAIIAIVILSGLFVAVYFFGWTAFGMFPSNSNDVKPNVEMSFDNSITNPIAPYPEKSV